MSNRAQYEMLFQLQAQLGGNFSGAFKKAQGEIASLQKDISVLSKTQSDISAYQKQQGAVDATQKKLQTLHQQYDNIQREMQETEGFSSSLENRLLSKQQQIDKTSSSLSQQTAKLEEMDGALRSAGIDTSNLGAKSADLTADIDKLKQKQEEVADAAEKTGQTSADAFTLIASTMASAGILKLLNTFREEMAECAEASALFEDAMTGISKTTDLSEEELAAMSRSMKNLSVEIPITTDELGAIGEAAGQLGIAKDNLLDFTTTMSMLGTATTMTAEEAATMLAQMTAITGMDPTYYSNLSSAIVDLGNNFSTTEEKITDMAQGISSAASIAGMSEADIVGVSAAVTSLGFDAALGSTQISKLISSINTAVMSGDGLNDWASAAGISAQSFAEAWGNNAAGGLDMFIQGLHETYAAGGDVYSVLSNLGITETRMVNVITSLAKSGEQLTNTLQVANTAWKENTALTTEAEKRYATTNSQLTMMKNAVNNTKVAVGDTLNPALVKLYRFVTDANVGLEEFISENQELSEVLVSVAAGAGVAVATISGISIVLNVLPKIISLWQTLQLTMMANPWVLAAMAIAGVVTALATLALSYEGPNAAISEHIKSLEESQDAYEEIVAGIAETSSSLEGLANIVSTLGSKTNKTAADEYILSNAIQQLNEQVPDMALAYDEATDSINMTGDAIIALAKKQAQQAADEAAAQRLKELYIELGDTQKLLSEKQAEMAAENYKYIDSLEDWLIYTSTGFGDAVQGMNSDQVAAAELEESIASLNEQIVEYEGEINAAAEQSNTIEGVMQNMATSISQLTTRYNEAKDAAHDSITSQYELWEKAAEIVATSASTINAGLDSQTQYWQDYDANLANLGARSAQIEGLSELIATFADGSSESVNAIAGMAGATDEELSAMVSKWNDLKAAQDSAEDELAALTTGMDAALEEIVKSTEDSIKSMDLSSEATAAAQDTIQAYIDQAASMETSVRNAYQRIADAAQKALGGTGSGSGTVTVALDGFASGTTNAPDMFVAGEEGPEIIVGAKGSTVFPTGETMRIMQAMQSGSSTASAALSSGSSSSGGGPQNIVFNVTNNVSGADGDNIANALEGYNEQLRDYICDALSDLQADARRKKY